MKRKLKGMIIIVFDIKGNIHKEFVPAGQATNYIYYFDVFSYLAHR
jgi:hypothetical protein